VADRDGVGRGAGGGGGGGGEEVGEEAGVGLEVGWELEEQEAEAAGGAGGFESGDELGEAGLGVAQAAEVGDALGGFEAEAEVGGRGGEPAFKHAGGWEGAEGVVDLDRGEAGGVVRKEVLGGGFGGVEAGLPGGVGPAGGAGEEPRGCVLAGGG
jgi:hypothetical protein